MDQSAKEPGEAALLIFVEILLIERDEDVTGIVHHLDPYCPKRERVELEELIVGHARHLLRLELLDDLAVEHHDVRLLREAQDLALLIATDQPVEVRVLDVEIRHDSRKLEELRVLGELLEFEHIGLPVIVEPVVQLNAIACVSDVWKASLAAIILNVFFVFFQITLKPIFEFHIFSFSVSYF